jgi:hypothetical protein
VTDLVAALADAGGAAAPVSASARIRRKLSVALEHGRVELGLGRSGYMTPVVVAIASARGHLVAAAPVEAAFRADPEASPERAWLLVAALVAALVDLADAKGRALVQVSDLTLRTGEHDGFLILALPALEIAPADLDDLVPLAFDERATGIDRLRTRALAVPAAVVSDSVADLRLPIGDGHPLRVAEAVARLGGQPADPISVDAYEDAVLALLSHGPAGGASRPHEDPDPGRRVARRILQRLAGMGKWGGYHTDFAHLARGFAGNERALAQEVGEALIDAGLLAQKPSVGQRHVFLNPRRAADIHRFIETGAQPAGLKLPMG